MSDKLCAALQAYVRAEIDLAFAEREEGADGYRHSTPDEAAAVSRALADLVSVLDGRLT